MVSKLLVVFLFISVGLAYNAKYGGELYQDGKNARNAAMGGLSVSYADGSNPVLLKNKKRPSIHFSHKNKYGGLVHVTILSYLHLRGKYPLYNKDYILTLINEMTIKEKHKLLHNSFNELWNELWGTNIGIQYRNEEKASKEKFNQLTPENAEVKN